MTLMEKYKIPVQHFEYSYIETCTDGRELEKIVQVLRSGEEGYFPDLTQFAENRLSVVKPKSKLLRKASPVVSKEALTRDERCEIANDLTQWVTNVSKDDHELSFFKNRKPVHGALPEVRETREEIVDEKKKTPKRISSTDYSSWDKYDPDTEILKIDLEEEKLKEKKKIVTKKTVQFKEYTTDVEALRQANYEKEKGNEFFKTGDYMEALRHYTNSINCKPTLASFTNRALANIKLKRFKNAIDDCHSALAIEPESIKALLRKAQALEGLGRHSEALETVEQTIEIDPNNTLAQELAAKLRTLCEMVPKGVTRFIVQEIEEIIIPIPGTSKMSPPYYITCPSDDPEKVRQEILRANTPAQIVHMVSVDNSDADDDDGCTINHLKRICGKENILNDSSHRQVPQQAPKEDESAGGERYIKESECARVPHTPYSFLKAWNSANADKTLRQHASILRSIDMTRIVDVIGCKLDNTMFSTIVKCLRVHFAVPGEVERLRFILENVVNLPRFAIISMLMSPDDRHCVTMLLNFLKQHEKPISEDAFNKLFNS